MHISVDKSTYCTKYLSYINSMELMMYSNHWEICTSLWNTTELILFLSGEILELYFKKYKFLNKKGAFPKWLSMNLCMHYRFHVSILETVRIYMFSTFSLKCNNCYQLKLLPAVLEKSGKIYSCKLLPALLFHLALHIKLRQEFGKIFGTLIHPVESKKKK